jgi:hypothetical protein
VNLLIAGSRGVDTIVAYDLICENINHPKRVDVLIHGGAQGVDWVAGQWARDRGIPVVVFHPPFDQIGRRAGPVRNEMMVRACDAALVLWDGVSPGTKTTIDFLRRHRKRYELCIVH